MINSFLFGFGGNMKKLVILILIISLISGCQSKNNNLKNEEIRKIDQSTVYASINDNNIYIIDVREPDEYSQSHIENAYNVPYTSITDISKLNINLDSKIIVYCQSGNRSRMAANRLIEMGYTNVYDMGGIIYWNYELVTE